MSSNLVWMGMPTSDFALEILAGVKGLRQFEMTGKYGPAICRLVINEPETWMIAWYHDGLDKMGTERILHGLEEVVEWCMSNKYPALDVTTIR